MIRNETDKHLNSFLPDQGPEVAEIAWLRCLSYHSCRTVFRKGNNLGGIYVVVFQVFQLHSCLVKGQDIRSSVHVWITSRDRYTSLFANLCLL